MLIHKIPPFFVKCLLLPCQAESLIVVLLLLLLVCRKGKLAFKTLLFVAFCVVVNVALKFTFQVPSHLTTAKGIFAFPSGHMQFSTVFYGWIAYHFHKYSGYSKDSKDSFERVQGPIENFKIYLIYTFLMLILLSVGSGLVIAGYHSTIDVIGGWMVGTLLVISLGLIEITMPRYMPILVAIIATACMIYIPFQYAPIPHHAWWTYQITMLLSVLWVGYQTK